jgi:hypothetical protein
VLVGVIPEGNRHASDDRGLAHSADDDGLGGLLGDTYNSNKGPMSTLLLSRDCAMQGEEGGTYLRR